MTQQVVDFVPYAGFLSALGSLPEPKELTMEICRQMGALLLSSFPSLRTIYQELCVNLGRCVSFTQNGVPCSGKAVGITEQGQLLVDCQGKAVALGAGECAVEGIYGCHL